MYQDVYFINSGLYFMGYLLELAFLIFQIFIYWKMFEKAGEKGWKYLIPIYGDYIDCKIIGKVKIFWVNLISTIGFIVLSSILLAILAISQVSQTEFLFLVLLFLSITYLIIIIVCQVIKAFATAKVFGQESIFGLGLLFLPIIFVAIIAFDKKIRYVYNDTTENN